ncbi:MAG: hypothetical protein J6B29_04830 [Clostridia bacterium]|nr:hypothetical protein [Clostridia bacterium]
MKKYIKPSFEIIMLETKDIMNTSGIVDNGQSSYEDENGNIISGQKVTFSSWFESIFKS